MIRSQWYLATCFTVDTVLRRSRYVHPSIILFVWIFIKKRFSICLRIFWCFDFYLNLKLFRFRFWNFEFYLGPPRLPKPPRPLIHRKFWQFYDSKFDCLYHLISIEFITNRSLLIKIVDSNITEVIQGAFLPVHPHFQYKNEKNLLSQWEAFLHLKFLEKVVLVGCNLFFILVLKIGRNS